mmetsp:Transcript_108291/g.241783  ORF Transcript_108291/g.241783 Transcript_108291/m.241783 type:complete len:225 (+) Transcript_108291:58-732(+)
MCARGEAECIPKPALKSSCCVAPQHTVEVCNPRANVHDDRVMAPHLHVPSPNLLAANARNLSPTARGDFLALKVLLQPHGVVPLVGHGEGLLDGYVLAIASADTDLVEGAGITIETHLQALHKESLRVRQANVWTPLAAEKGHRQVRAKAGGAEIVFIGGALVVNVREHRRCILLLSDDNELVEQGIHLAASVVHHPTNVRGVLMGAHAAPIFMKEVLFVKLVQ